MQDIPYGYCGCGCGERVAGRFKRGHASRLRIAQARDALTAELRADPLYGFCHCGCGGATPIAPQTVMKMRRVQGEPTRFIQGHENIGSGKPLSERYTVEDRGHSTPCWVWDGKRDPHEYGIRSDDSKAHRAAYEEWVGPIPDGLEIDHLCFQPDCINPDHLEAVTHVVNLRRRRVTKLSEDNVALIRARLAAGERATDLASEYGVSRPHISFIRHGKVWK